MQAAKQAPGIGKQQIRCQAGCATTHHMHHGVAGDCVARQWQLAWGVAVLWLYVIDFSIWKLYWVG